jgi:putative DNA methylase
MAMDDESFAVRWKRQIKPKEILAKVSISRISDYFVDEPDNILPTSSPIDWSKPEYAAVKVSWRENITELERRRLEAQLLPKISYRQRVSESFRPEEVIDSVHDHIWYEVNRHLGTEANSLSELVEQLGIMRYGKRPRIADTFSGSGQIPFEAARLGCNVYASDINPVASMLTWGAFNIIGSSESCRSNLINEQHQLIQQVQNEIDNLGVELDGKGWRAKAFLYCVEARCPQTGWVVPLLPTRVVSKGRRVIAELVPNFDDKIYDITIRSGVSNQEMIDAELGTLRSDGRGKDPYLVHSVSGVEYRTKVSTLRGDYRKEDGTIGNRLRRWEKDDFKPKHDDIFQERLYAIQWTKPKKNGKGEEIQFRSVSHEDILRERFVEDFIEQHLSEWQNRGWLPDMRIESGEKTDEPIRTRGWTYWHHLFNPRQLMIAGFYNGLGGAESKFGLTQILNFSSRLSPWATASARIAKDGSGKHIGGASDNVANTFYNQALNTLYMYGTRATASLLPLAIPDYKLYTLNNDLSITIDTISAKDITEKSDVFITDPPYGDAVKYEEILEFFIAWLRKNPPPEFSNWIWDSRRSLAIKGEDEDFRRGMVLAYKRMTECMPDNGMQVIMFTHQSGSIWADMANIVWASGLQVTAAWYIVTETDSPLREGSYVKGTVLLVCRKREGSYKTTRDDLAWEIQEEVETQVQSLVGLNQSAKGIYRDENVFEDADLQMAGYAAALRVLTRYAIIDGRDMSAEAIRPRVKGEITFVDSLIAFAVDTANQSLVPQGIEKKYWDKLTGVERFYLKMLDMESRGAKTLDNYQNFAKAFKVANFKPLLASQKANDARLKSSLEFGRTEMGEGSQLYESVLRAVLYAIMELDKNMDGDEVLTHLMLNIPNYYGDMTQRELAMELAEYLGKRLDHLRPEEASNARVLYELLKNQRLG